MKKDPSEVIIVKSIKVFSKKGVTATIQDIAQSCKVSPGSIYYYFKDKHDLLFEAMYYVGKKLSMAIGEVIDAAADTETNYKKALGAVIEFVKKNNDESAFYAMTHTLHYQQPFTELQYAKILDLCPMTKLLEKGIKEGDIRNIPVIHSIAYFPVFNYTLVNNFTKKSSTKEQDELLINSLWQAIAA